MATVDFQIPSLASHPKKPSGLNQDQIVDYLVDALRTIRDDQAKIVDAIKKARTDINLALATLPTFGGTVTGARDETEGAMVSLLDTLEEQLNIVDATTAS